MGGLKGEVFRLRSSIRGNSLGCLDRRVRGGGAFEGGVEADSEEPKKKDCKPTGLIGELSDRRTWFFEVLVDMVRFRPARGGTPIHSLNDFS